MKTFVDFWLEYAERLPEETNWARACVELALLQAVANDLELPRIAALCRRWPESDGGEPLWRDIREHVAALRKDLRSDTKLANKCERANVDKLRAEVKQWREACAKRDAEIVDLNNKLDNAYENGKHLAATHAIALAEKDRRISVLRGRADYLERDLLGALEDVDTLERKMSDYKDLQAECDCLQSMLTQAQRELAQRCSESVTVQPSEEADAWQPYTHGHPLAEGDYWLRFSDDTVSVIPLQWRFVDEYGDVHGVWVMAVDPAGIDTKDMEDPETIVAVLPVRRPTAEAQTAEPAPDLRPVPAWLGGLGEEWRPAIWRELDTEPSVMVSAAQDQPADEPPLTPRQTTERQRFREAACEAEFPLKEEGSALVATVGPGSEWLKWSPDGVFRVFRWSTDKITLAEAISQMRRWRCETCEGTGRSRAFPSLGCEACSPEPEEPDDLPDWREESGQPPDPRPVPEPPTFAAQIRAHAERAGYEFFEFIKADPAKHVRARWHVAAPGQMLMRQGHTGDLLEGLSERAWVTLTEARALRIAEAWPDKAPDHLVIAARALDEAREHRIASRDTCSPAIAALIQAVDALILSLKS